MKTLFIKCTRVIIPFLLVLMFSDSMAQTRKGERLFKEGRYEEAVKPLKRAFDSDMDDRRAGYLLAETYYILQRYDDALDVAELMDIPRSEDEKEMTLLADVLIANNDFSLAYLNLTRMLSKGGAKSQGYKWLNKTADLLDWDGKSTGSTITDIEGLNTVYNEYAPTVTEDGLIYIADHLTVQVLYPSAFTNQSLHLLFESEISDYGKFGRSKMLIKGKDYYYHDGPFEKRPETEMYALTLREIEGLLYDLKMNIYFSNLNGSEQDLIAFKYNDGTFNTGHPTFSDNGKRMYFTSDRPGGYGQLDLWYSDWVGGEWTLPKNAGPGINSPDNELYPKICNNRLFFSSDRRGEGYGGLDLYYVSLLTADKDPYNLRAPINSAYDDFAVDFIDNKSGYFSSNRKTGFGGDDIYKMYFQPESAELDTLTFALEDMSGTKKTLRIYDSSGNEMVGINNEDKTMTISGLVTRELYTIKTDSVFSTSLKLVAYNGKGQKVQEFTSESAIFNVEFLEQDEYDLGKEENFDDSELFDLSGMVVASESEDFDKVSVVLQDDVGASVGEAKTDSTGRFLFRGLNWDRPYNLATIGTTGEVEIDVLGQTGAPLTVLEKEKGTNTYAYTRTRPEADWMTITQIKLPAIFGMVPSAELIPDDAPEIRALGDSLIRITEVDEDGFIEMGSLITGHAYELVFNKSTFNPSDRLVIIDGFGDTTQTVRPDGVSSFVFELMIPSGKKLMEKQGTVEIERQAEETEKDENIEEEVEEESKTAAVLDNLSGESTELKAGDELKLYDSSNEFLSTTRASEGGLYTFSQVPLDSVYFVSASIKDKVKMTSTHHGTSQIGSLEANGKWKFDYTAPLEEEKVIKLTNIYYRFDHYTLSNESKKSLENLYGFLRQNPNQKIKVLSHTDSRGPRAYNEQLSNLRAREVVRYLIRKGIDSDRLSYEGRGESQLINECKDGVSCTNEKHAENRRTEFVLIRN